MSEPILSCPTIVHNSIFPRSKHPEMILLRNQYIPGEYFYASTDLLKEVMYCFNRDFQISGYAFVSDFLDLLGIPSTEESKEYGWSAYHMSCDGLTPWIDFTISEASNGAYYDICFTWPPQHRREFEDEW